MDLIKVLAAVGGKRIGALFIPQIFRDLLRENADTHRRLGEIPALKALENPNLTSEQYVAALKKMYGLYAVLEPKLESAVNWKQIGIDFNVRRRLPWLEKDLQKFGIAGEALSDIPVFKELPEFNTLSEVLGCMAVVEGSSAGATATAQKLAVSKLALGPDNGAQFFNNYGDARNEMRMSFGQAVKTANINEKEFLSGGKKAFDLFYSWLSE